MDLHSSLSTTEPTDWLFLALDKGTVYRLEPRIRSARQLAKFPRDEDAGWENAVRTIEDQA